jgi:hypothetical protein
LIDEVLHSQAEIEGANVPQAIQALMERVKEDTEFVHSPQLAQLGEKAYRIVYAFWLQEGSPTDEHTVGDCISRFYKTYSIHEKEDGEGGIRAKLPSVEFYTQEHLFSIHPVINQYMAALEINNKTPPKPLVGILMSLWERYRYIASDDASIRRFLDAAHEAIILYVINTMNYKTRRQAGGVFAQRKDSSICGSYRDLDGEDHGMVDVSVEELRGRCRRDEESDTIIP